MLSCSNFFHTTQGSRGDKKAGSENTSLVHANANMLLIPVTATDTERDLLDTLLGAIDKFKVLWVVMYLGCTLTHSWVIFEL